MKTGDYLQAQGYCNNPLKYKGMVDVWQQAMRKEVRFFNSLGVELARAYSTEQ